jgi:hypothetical protein
VLLVVELVDARLVELLQQSKDFSLHSNAKSQRQPSFLATLAEDQKLLEGMDACIWFEEINTIKF